MAKWDVQYDYSGDLTRIPRNWILSRFSLEAESWEWVSAITRLKNVTEEKTNITWNNGNNKPATYLLRFFSLWSLSLFTHFFFQLLYLNPIRPRGGGVLFAIPLSKLIANVFWMGISISKPDGFSSWRYLHWLLNSKTLFICEFF